jgi:hypothetical protein
MSDTSDGGGALIATSTACRTNFDPVCGMRWWRALYPVLADQHETWTIGTESRVLSAIVCGPEFGPEPRSDQTHASATLNSPG